MILKPEHIIPYLGTGLICQTKIKDSDGKNSRLKLEGFSNNMAMFNLDGKNIISQELSAIKPILRPKDDLIKVLENEKGRSVALGLLYVINSEEEATVLDIHSSDEDLAIIVEDVNDNPNGFSNPMYFVFNKKTNDFSLRDMTNYSLLEINNQHKLFNMLLDWHIDIFDLIPQNLAIDINNLK